MRDPGWICRRKKRWREKAGGLRALEALGAGTGRDDRGLARGEEAKLASGERHMKIRQRRRTTWSALMSVYL